MRAKFIESNKFPAPRSSNRQNSNQIAESRPRKTRVKVSQNSLITRSFLNIAESSPIQISAHPSFYLLNSSDFRSKPSRQPPAIPRRKFRLMGKGRIRRPRPFPAPPPRTGQDGARLSLAYTSSSRSRVDSPRQILNFEPQLVAGIPEA
jgi:hypothetical protein